MRGRQKTPGAWLEISLRGLSAAPAQSRAARSQSLTSGPASTLVSRSRVRKASRHFAVTLELVVGCIVGCPFKDSASHTTL